MAPRLYDIDASHSLIGFAVRHMLIAKVHGRFDEWSGTVNFDQDDLGASRVQVRIAAASIDTRESQRDEHLRSADFLEVTTYPEITYSSTGIKERGRGRFQIVGDLVVRGVSREVVVDARYNGRVRDPAGRERIGFEGRTVVDRGDFGLRWNALVETGGVVVGEKIEIGLQVEAVRREGPWPGDAS
jgi:polyisoprenoid-binding protein YceI